MQDEPYRPPAAPSNNANVVARDQAPASPQSVSPSRGVQWLLSGWRLFRRQAGIWILLTLVLGLIMAGLFLIPVVGGLAFSLLMPVFAGGLMMGSRKVEAAEELELADLFSGFRRSAGNLVLIGVIALALSIAAMVPMTLLVGATGLATLASGSPEAVGTGTLAVTLLFLVLMIPINMAVWFAPALVVFDGYGPVGAMLASFRACLRNIPAFLLYGVVLFVLAMLASIPFGLGWLVLLPVLVSSIYAAYREIFHAA